MKHVEQYLIPLMYGVLATNPLTFHQCLETAGHSGLSMSLNSSFPVPTNNLTLSCWDQKTDPSLHHENLDLKDNELWCDEMLNTCPECKRIWDCECIKKYTPSCPTTPIQCTVDDNYCSCIVGPLYWCEEKSCSVCSKCGLAIWCPWF